jgi:hypothetical protein
MTAGNIFTIMMNDGKQDIMLNATEKLLKRIREIRKQQASTLTARECIRFSTPPAEDDRTYTRDYAEWKRDPKRYIESRSRAVHSTLVEILKTHNMFVGRTYKPFVAMSFSHLKVIEKQGQPRFGGDTSFVVPRIGTWVHNMGLHVRLTGLRCLDERDKVKYCSMLGHRLIEQAEFLVNGVPICTYGTEHINKHFQFHVPPHKQRAWLNNIGQEIPHLAYVTPDPRVNEYREYRWFGDGPQTLKREHTEVDLYIPLIFWFNLDVAQAFPNCTVPHGGVKVRFKFAPLEKLVAAVDYGGGGRFIPPVIQTCDLYVEHINTLPEIEEIMMRDYVYSLIRIPRSMTQTLQLRDGSVLLKDLKYPTEHIAVAFRPVENLEDIDLWHRNTWLDRVDVMLPMAVTDRTVAPPEPVIGINFASYYTEMPTIENVGMTVSGGIEIHPQDTVKKYSSFHTFSAPGMVAPEDQGWLLFTHQFNQGYHPSGHIDLSRNREIYLNYSGAQISDLRKVQLYVEAQCINFLTIKDRSVNLKYYK